MFGEFNSVLSRVKGQQENLWFLYCTCHVAHLAASHASMKYQMTIPSCLHLLQNIWERQDEFHNIQKSLGTKEHKILWPCFTRWLVMLQCVECLLEQWPALTLFRFPNSKQCILESVYRIKLTLLHYLKSFIFSS
ncbi:hypothetical protein PR048_008045 [Dryococelus australis]|uniref:Uncharacterized protein n=1 Tax=Dryococelus australis TaxID=614101 RepID=A0ABQ9HVZ8_9NEOP|nr:hypothetical protein PR048_008045 [Dryococelus australis]